MKVCIVHVTAEEVSGPYTDQIVPNFERVKRPDTEIVHKYVAHLRRATDTVFAYPTLLNKVDVIARAVEAEREGCDAVMVACSGDTGVGDARTVVRIPVVGPMEAGMLLACSYGYRFGIVTVDDRTWSSYMHMAVHQAGLAQRFAGLKQIKTTSKVAFTSGWTTGLEALMEDVRSSALELVAEGAEAIVIGSAGLSVMSTTIGMGSVGDHLEVPVFDCLTAGLKMAELRADLQHHLGIPAVSGGGWSAHFGADDRARVDRLFGFQVAAEVSR